MSERTISSRGTALPLLSVAETASLGLVALSMVMLFALQSKGFRVGRAGHIEDEIWLYAPHIVLAALIVAGLRSLAALVATLVLLAAALLGMVSCLDAAVGGHRAFQGLGLVTLIQVLVAWIVWHAKRNPDEGSPMTGPRLALGAMAAAAGWLAMTSGLTRLDAPRRAAEAAVARSAERTAAERAMRDQFFQLAACIQRSPAGADSQPLFPASLAELARRGDCPAAARRAPAGFVFDYSPGAADSAGGRHTFLLAGREEPMTDSSRKYTTDETFAIRGWYGRESRYVSSQSAPLGTLAEAGRCVEAGRDTVTGAYPRSLAELVRVQQCNLTLVPDSSAFRATDSYGQYLVRYAPPAGVDSAHPGRYELTMEPLRDSAGRAATGALLSFFVDTSGAIHMTRRARAATAVDPALPDCPRDRLFGDVRQLYCRAYSPRQRWGRTSELPTIGVSLSGNGTVASGDTLYFIPYYRLITPADSVVEARISWSAGARDSVIHHRDGSIGESAPSATLFRLKHVYADTGWHQIRFRVRTGAREEYEVRDSVRVLVRWRRR